MNHFLPPAEALMANAIAVLAVFLVLLALLARKETGWALLSFLRLLLAYMTAPLLTLVGMVRDLVAFGRHGDAIVMNEGRPSLLRTVLALGRGLVVATALVVLAAGTVTAANLLLPDPDAVQALKRLEASVAKARQDSEAAASKLSSFQAQLAARKAQLVTSFRETRKQAQAEAEKEQAAAVAAVQGNEAATKVLGEVQTYLAGKQADLPSWALDQVMTAVENHLRQNLPADQQAPVRQYAEAWKRRHLAALELATFSEADMLRSLDAEQQQLKAQADEAASDLKAEASRLPQAREQARWRPDAAGTALAIALGQTFGLIWTAGLVLEVLARLLDLGDDVRAIRPR